MSAAPAAPVTGESRATLGAIISRAERRLAEQRAERTAAELRALDEYVATAIANAPPFSPEVAARLKQIWNAPPDLTDLERLHEGIDR